MSIVRVPDLGVDKAEVIELLVNPGDSVEAEQGLVLVESDKASMEIPAGQAGVVEALLVSPGDTITQGQELAKMAGGQAATTQAEQPAGSKTESAAGSAGSTAPAPAAPAEQASPVPAPATAPAGKQPIHVPDLGVDSASIIEVLAQPGDSLEAEQGLVMVESDKASMEIPSPVAGRLVSLTVKVGDSIASGDVLGEIEASGAAASAPQAMPAPEPALQTVAQSAAPQPANRPATAPAATTPGAPIYAGPAVRKLARQLGLELHNITASGPNGRLLKDDIHAYVRGALSAAPAGASGGVASYTSAPIGGKVDFSKFGEVRIEPMTRLHQLTADNMAKTSLVVPQVTQFDNADITELEVFRKAMQEDAAKHEVKLTLVAFLVMACAKALRALPQANVAIDQHQIIYKQYCNIGLAVDTPAGLMVPVIRDADQKGLYQLAGEIIELAGKARKKSLKPAEMQGGCFTISSLGGIGGTNFTPLVNHPEVAILGVCKSTMQPVWDGTAFVPRLLCPLALSYDHRAVNGADGARLLRLIGDWLEDPRKMLL